MRALILIVLLALPVFAQSEIEALRATVEQQKEEISALKAMLKLTAAQTDLAIAEARHQQQQSQRKAAQQQASDEYAKLLEELRQKHGKEAFCVLNADVKWICDEKNTDAPVPGG